MSYSICNEIIPVITVVLGYNWYRPLKSHIFQHDLLADRAPWWLSIRRSPPARADLADLPASCGHAGRWSSSVAARCDDGIVISGVSTKNEP